MKRSTTLRSKVTQKGQTVVPGPIRKKHGIGPNSLLIWNTDGKVITVIPVPADPIKSLRGYTSERELRKALIRSRREDEAKG